MAKSTKFSSKVPALADYKPSFVNDDGEIDDVDKVIKAFHTLMADKAKAQDAREDALAENIELAKVRDELQEKVDDKNAPDAQAEIAKANKTRDEALETAKKATLRADRLEVAAEKGLTPEQAEFLQGESKEDLEAAAEKILKVFPASKGGDDEDEEGEDGQGRTQPIVPGSRLTNGGDSRNGSIAEPDYEKIAADISAKNPFQ